MKLERNYRMLFTFTIAFFITAIATSQILSQPEADADLKRSAREAVEFWENELSLSAKQAKLMEKKIIEYAFEKNQLLLSKMREEAKIERLRRLQEQEHADMRDILTKPQFDRYMTLYKERIREQYQDQ